MIFVRPGLGILLLLSASAFARAATTEFAYGRILLDNPALVPLVP